MLANLASIFLALGCHGNSHTIQNGPPRPVDPVIERQIREQLEQLKQQLRRDDEEHRRLLIETDKSMRQSQESIDRAEKEVREAQYMLAKLKAPRVHLPRPGLVYEYQRMASEARRAGQRVGP